MELYCGCGKSGIEISAEPRARMLCHCTLCQRFNRAPQADICIFRKDEVTVIDGSPIHYQRLKSTMAVDRGACEVCGQPVVEYLDVPLIPAMCFVPAQMLEEHIVLPEPAMRLFYDSRVEDVDDYLPRHHGFLASQFAATRVMLPALLR